MHLIEELLGRNEERVLPKPWRALLNVRALPDVTSTFKYPDHQPKEYLDLIREKVQYRKSSRTDGAWPTFPRIKKDEKHFKQRGVLAPLFRSAK